MPERVFLFDVDNTLLDNDRVRSDITARLDEAHGVAARERYWVILEALRKDLGYVDYLGALQRYRLENMHDFSLRDTAVWMIEYPFPDRVFPGAFEAVNHVKRFGEAAILSDGDGVFQPLKIARSGLGHAFENRVMIYVHKEKELAEVERRAPAAHYVMIDDKLRLLTAIKAIWKERVTTVFVKQGHYAFDPEELAGLPAADIELAKIADLTTLSFT
jgi:FMN phosphatase YigB (HAD superfamily)